MPLRLVMFSVHNWLTKRDYAYSADDLCDIIGTIILSYWIYMRRNWADKCYELGEKIPFITTELECYAYYTIGQHLEGKFRIMIFLAILLTAMWARFILMLQLTLSFGPLLRIIMIMFKEASKFLFIWLVVLFCLASVAALVFGDIDLFREGLTNILFLTFGTSLGNYEFEIFDSQT